MAIGAVFTVHKQQVAPTEKSLPTLYNRHSCVQNFGEIINLLEVGPLLDQRVTTLSGREKQRVTITRALILDPSLILADEPTGNLDPVNREIIFRLLQREYEKGRGILLITHDSDTANQAKSTFNLIDGQLTELSEMSPS